MLSVIFIWVCCCYLFIKSYKKKDVKPLVGAIILILLYLSKWPFYLPIFISFGLQALFAGGLVFYEYYIKQKDRLAVIFCIMFVGFGLIFFAQAIPKDSVVVKGFIHKVIEIANK
jgi:hypothetical protein